MDRDKRITVKELKAWLADKDDAAEVFVEKYANEHSKEYLMVRDWTDMGKLDEKEILVASIKIE